MKRFTREELYDLVWTESRLSLATRLGVSDVWIRKACVKADIPVPPPGHWARAAAGKRTTRPALPMRGLGKQEVVVLGADAGSHLATADDIEVPPAMVFDEPIDAVRRRAQSALGQVAAPRGFAQVHPDVDKLLEEDEARRAALAQDRYSWKKPRFDCPAALRRLRIVNALLVILARAGCRGHVDRHDLSIYMRVGDTGLSVELSAQGTKRNSNAVERTLELADPQKETLVLRAAGGERFEGVAFEWRDTDGEKLERQLPAIAVELLVRGEMQYRSDVAQDRQWMLEEKARREAEARRQRLEAERREAERVERLERARCDHLLKLADRLRTSEDIRALVAAVLTPENGSRLSEWRTWALGVADRLDPRLLPLDELRWSPPPVQPPATAQP